MSRPVSAIKAVEDNPIVGVGLMICAVACFSGLDAMAKYLVVSDVPALQVVLMRYLAAFVLVLGAFLPTHGRQLFHTRNLKMELLRGAMLLLTTVTNFVALRYLPLTMTATFIFSAPLLITALSVPLLGEKVGWRRWVAVFVGFIGVVIVINPGGMSFHWAMLVSLSSVLGLAFYSILSRKLAGVDSVHSQQFYATGVAVVCVIPMAIPYWVWPESAMVWVGFGALGVLAFVGHILLTTAFRFASASTLAPFSYPQIIFMSLLSWLVFAQPPGLSFYAGVPLVVASGLYIWMRERRLANKRAVVPTG